MYSKELLKGTFSVIILKLLTENGRMYGYEITKHVQTLTGDRIKITEGALYPTLHRLELEGAVVTETEYIGKRVRKYYRLTEQGNALAKERVNELADFIESLQILLKLTPSVNPVI
jgi:PadR family transcriptional regulator, regulatory protein PadR